MAESGPRDRWQWRHETETFQTTKQNFQITMAMLNPNHVAIQFQIQLPMNRAVTFFGNELGVVVLEQLSSFSSNLEWFPRYITQ